MHRLPEASRTALPGTAPGDPLDEALAALPSREPVNVRHYLLIAYRSRWLTLCGIALGLLASTLYNARATKIYESWATLQIEADPNVLGLDRPLVEQRDWMREFLPTQFRLLESRALASMAREELKAARAEADDPEAGLPSVDDIVDGRAIEAVKETRIIDIGFRSTDAEMASAVANALAQAYVNWNSAARSSTTREVSGWLTQQVEEQRKLVAASEAELQRYQTRHKAEGLGERGNIVEQRLAELQSRGTGATAVMIEKESKYRQLSELVARGAPLDTHPEIASNPYVRESKAELASVQQQLADTSRELGDLHPDIIRLRAAVANAERKLELETSKAATAIRHEYESARASAASLRAAFEQQRSVERDLQEKAIEYTALVQTAEANRELLDKLLQRSREISISRDLPGASARILDAAEVPGGPILPRKERNNLLGVVGGAVFALGLVFLLEAFNTRVTSPDDVRRHLRIRVLGIAPDVKALNGHAPLLLGDGAPPQFTELLQGVRTNLVTAPEFATARALLVTSAEPGEGKTMTAANLAVSLARLNQRVLLIDADLRKPRLHELFGVERKPGLTDVLTGRATRDAFQQTKVGRLWLMPAGDDSCNPTDLLGSERFSQLIDTLRGQFDWVVLDSPPVLAVTDPCLIARVASGVLFVVGSGTTSRDAAAAAVERLDAVGATFVGAMLNRVVLDGSGRSYLSYYRGYPLPDDRQPDSSLAPDLPAPPVEVEVEVESPPPPRPRTRRYTAVADALGEARNPWDI